MCLCCVCVFSYELPVLCDYLGVCACGNMLITCLFMMLCVCELHAYVVCVCVTILWVYGCVDV